MKRLIVLGASVTALLVLAQARAPAADMAALGDAVAVDRLEVTKLTADMSGEIAENAGYKQEYDAYEVQMKIRLKPLIDAYNAKLVSHNDYAAKVNAEVGRHNASCHGTVPPAVYARCTDDEPPLQRMIDDVSARKAVLDTQKAELAKQQDQYKTAMDSLAAKMTANRTAWERNNARVDALVAKIRTAEMDLGDLCKGTPLDQRNVPQYVKYCASAGVDNPNPSGKPLEQGASPQGVRTAPN